MLPAVPLFHIWLRRFISRVPYKWLTTLFLRFPLCKRSCLLWRITAGNFNFWCNNKGRTYIILFGTNHSNWCTFPKVFISKFRRAMNESTQILYSFPIVNFLKYHISCLELLFPILNIFVPLWCFFKMITREREITYLLP